LLVATTKKAHDTNDVLEFFSLRRSFSFVISLAGHHYGRHVHGVQSGIVRAGTEKDLGDLDFMVVRPTKAGQVKMVEQGLGSAPWRAKAAWGEQF